MFVVGYRGDWRRAAAILFERESLQGLNPPSRKAREENTGTFETRTSGGGGFGTDLELSGGLIAHAVSTREGARQDISAETFITSETIPASAAETARPAGQGNELDFCITHKLGVRRLTPLECERLMGFPDRYTDIPFGKNPAKDSPRYKALGNSMVVNVMKWIGHRIQLVEEL